MAGALSPGRGAGSCRLAGGAEAALLLQVIEKERPQLAECEESSVYSPAIPREKWQRKRTQVKIRVRGLHRPEAGAAGLCPSRGLHGGTGVRAGDGAAGVGGLRIVG